MKVVSARKNAPCKCILISACLFSINLILGPIEEIEHSNHSEKGRKSFKFGVKKQLRNSLGPISPNCL